MITFKGEAYVYVNQEMVPVKKLGEVRAKLLDEAQDDEVLQLFLSTCTTEQLCDYMGEQV